jgi:hypothetical protein
MEKRGSRIHAVVELVCDHDELLSERVSTKLVRATPTPPPLPLPLPPHFVAFTSLSFAFHRCTPRAGDRTTRPSTRRGKLESTT